MKCEVFPLFKMSSLSGGIDIGSFIFVAEFVVERSEENGGSISFKNYASLEETFAKKVTRADSI